MQKKYFISGICLIALFISYKAYPQDNHEPALLETIPSYEYEKMKIIIERICVDIKGIKNKYKELSKFGESSTAACGEVTIRYFPDPLEEYPDKKTYIDIYFDKRSPGGVEPLQKPHTEELNIYIKETGRYLHIRITTIDPRLRKEIIQTIKDIAKIYE